MLPTVPNIQATYEAMSTLGEKLVTGFQKVPKETLDYFINGFKNSWIGGEGVIKPAAWDSLLNGFVNGGLITHSDASRLKKFAQTTFPFDWIWLAIVFWQLMSNFIISYCEANMMKISQTVNKEARNALPDMGMVVDAAFIAPEKTGMVRDVLAKMGLSEDYIDLAFLSRYAKTDVNTVMTLWLRKEIDDNKMYERMRELGYTDTRIAEIVKVYQIIPPVQDLLTMVAHEAFEPDAIELMGLDKEFPTEQSEWLTKQGLSPFWQMKYWISHWEQPSIQMGYEMLQRGIIGMDELDMLFRTVEIPQYWREKLVAIAYTPYTRVDTRRMYQLGVLNDADLVKSYKDIGYDQDHAEKMAIFTKRLATAKDRGLTKGEILRGYKDKLIKQEDVVALLAKLNYTADESGYFIALEDYKEQNNLQELLLKNVQSRYQNGLIDKANARNLLDQLNLPSAQRDALLDQWEINVIRDQKIPSKSDLDAFYVNGIISAEIYRRELTRLGYASEYVNWYHALSDIIIAKKAPKLIPQSIQQ